MLIRFGSGQRSLTRPCGFLRDMFSPGYGPLLPVPSLFRTEFQKLIRLNLKYVGDVEKQVNRQTAVHVWGFNSCQMLTADTEFLSQLLLRQTFAPAEIAYGAVQVSHSLTVVKSSGHFKCVTPY